MADGLKIKCSTCAVDIDISELADHVCAATPINNNEPLSPKLERATTFGSSSSSNPSSQRRSGRMPPPARIDSDAANKPFRPQNQLSPDTSYSAQQTLSPRSPGYGQRPYQPLRSATSPVAPRRPMAPPSPDLPPNMDCAFPPFPTSRSGTPSSGKPKPRPRDPAYKHQYAQASPLYAPLSPRINGGETVLKRLDNIAPGPFDGSDRRPSTADGRSTPSRSGPELGHRRTATQGSVRSVGKGPTQRSSLASNASRTSTFSNRSVGLPSRPKPSASDIAAMPPPLRPPRDKDQSEGIDAFLSRLQKETMQAPPVDRDIRLRAYPARQESNDSVAPPPPRPRRPSESNQAPRQPLPLESFKPNNPPNNLFPSRGSSRSGSKADIRLDTRPLPPPLPNYGGKEVPANPVHTPSDSGLSEDSYSSEGFRSVASSRSSPPASEASGQHSRNVSKMGRNDYMHDDPIPRVASPESFLDPRSPPKPVKRSESRDPSSRHVPEPLLQPPTRQLFDAPESPMDPAIQRGLAYDRRPPQQPLPRADPALNLGGSPPPSRGRDTEPDARDRTARRPTTAARAKCRGCGQPIIGKSVKDSSGRLKGRYHRECFVCRTCGDPFPTADFYVFENFPYCEHHYHELNGSLCQSCNRGIEGQYLETDARQKFHPRCFTCLTCRIVLRDDYYEVGGKTYCERHAYAAQRGNMSLAPGSGQGRNVQKRRTRLMMM